MLIEVFDSPATGNKRLKQFEDEDLTDLLDFETSLVCFLLMCRFQSAVIGAKKARKATWASIHVQDRHIAIDSAATTSGYKASSLALLEEAKWFGTSLANMIQAGNAGKQQGYSKLFEAIMALPAPILSACTVTAVRLHVESIAGSYHACRQPTFFLTNPMADTNTMLCRDVGVAMKLLAQSEVEEDQQSSSFDLFSFAAKLLNAWQLSYVCGAVRRNICS